MVRLWHDHVLRNPADQLGCDDLILRDIGKGEAVIRVWRNRDTLAVSRHDANYPDFGYAAETLTREGMAVTQRSTGGTAVAHISGTLNVSLVFAEDRRSTYSVEESYRELISPMLDYLASLGISAGIGEVPGSFCSGRHDAIWEGRKLAGTAQRVCRMADASKVLGHYTLNVDCDVTAADELINRFYKLSGCPRRVEPGRACSVEDYT